MALLTVDCVTINALNPSALARFWASIAGGTVRDSGNGFVLVEPEAGGMRLLFQQAQQPSAEPGWVHLDCTVTDRAAAEKEICQRGGRTIEHRSDSNGSWIVMADPEGNPFCI
ncbi:MAG: VOC family protein [Micropruina sp.]|nr:VOC family protein [Micropruina sp.]